ETAQNTVKTLKEEERVRRIYDTKICGQKVDLEIEKKVKGIDLIIAEHTHILVDKMWVVNNEEPTIVAQAKEYGPFLGRVDVVFDEYGVV
ncbi:UNVERIFIED_CONTAM: hypothetical protein FO517_22615, partial [Bacillus subtilis]